MSDAQFLRRGSNVTKMIIIIEFLLVTYLIYSLTKNVYDSYQVDKLIVAFEQENSLYEQENKQRSEDYLYFTSEEYIDKIAKQNLNLVNPGEEVIILSPDVLDPEFDGEVSDFENLAVEGQAPVWKRWWELFFGA